jgi:hypothetical protein
MIVTNAPAYYEMTFVTSVKSFIIEAFEGAFVNTVATRCVGAAHRHDKNRPKLPKPDTLSLHSRRWDPSHFSIEI